MLINVFKYKLYKVKTSKQCNLKDWLNTINLTMIELINQMT